MNFSAFLFFLTVVAGLSLLAERFWLAPRRAQALRRGLDEFDQQLKATGYYYDPNDRDRLIERLSTRSAWIDQTSYLFPVLLVIFLLRSFVFEPYKIPSGSMTPTLLTGDYIFVSKFSYGERLPIVNAKLFDTGLPHRGDTMVFRYPIDESQTYIKRVIGEPGDLVSYRSKRLSINHQSALYTPDLSKNASGPGYQGVIETLPGGAPHRARIDVDAPALRPEAGSFAGREACSFFSDGFECRVPAGRYFMMGDNRDHSSDSRYWGFVSERQIVGPARWVWLNFSDMSRVGSFERRDRPIS